MKKLTLKLLFIISPLLLFAVLTEVSVRSIPNDYSYKSNYLHDNANKIEFLVLGSSHSFYGINPDYFSLKSFNASHVSQSLDYDLFIFNKYKNQMPNLKSVFLPISYFTLNFKLGDSTSRWREKNYVLYYDSPATLIDKNRYEILNEKIPVLIKRILYKIIRGTNEITCSELGFGLDYTNKKQKNLVESGKTAATRHTEFDGEGNLAHNMAVLRDFVQECKERNIHVILFTPPAWHTYRDNLNKMKLDVVVGKAESLATNNSNVEYLNLLEDSQFYSDDFHDADHLAGKGARKLTILLDKFAVGLLNL
jgi:hypothetical protein